MKIEKVDISEVKFNKKNPRTIKDDKFKKLVKSIKDFPEMLEVRPIVVDDDFIVLGGNMRLKACKEAGLVEVPIIKFSDLSEEKKKEFIVKDNVGYGEWDWEILNDENEWDKDLLGDWGLDIIEKNLEESINNYSKKIKSPVYEKTTDEKPDLKILFNDEKYNILVDKIKKSNVDNNIKDFLLKAATRFIIFNYENIAEYYCHSDKETQELMEDLALIIIDFDKAIENGFIHLSEETIKQYDSEYE